MPTYYVDVDERYPDYIIEDKRAGSYVTECVDLTEEEAKCVVSARILYNYWQRFISDRVRKLEK